MWDAEAFRRSKCFRFTLLLFAEAFSESIMLSVLDGEEEMGKDTEKKRKKRDIQVTKRGSRDKKGH